jgi:hypothetical protein
LLRFVKGERPQEDGIEHAKDGGVRTNAERESEDYDSAKKRLFEKGAERIAKIPHKKLFGTQRDDRVHLGGAASRQDAGKQSDQH